MKRGDNFPDDSPSPGTEAEQPSKDYYYDDAMGYEIYNPEIEEDNEEVNEG
jgi:hypothetical protein